MSAFFLCTHVFAQFGELLPGSSELVYDAKTGIHKLLDGANFIYQGNTMYCDSAYYLEKNKTIRAYGNVHIRKSDNVNLFCDSLHYFSSNGLAYLWGKVRATDSEYRLTTDSMIYNTRNEQGIYRNGGKIENQFKKEVLTSKVGYFYPNSKNFFFRTNVVYESDAMRMTTDSLQYQYSKSTVYFYGPTCIVTDEAILEGERGWYNLTTEDGSLMKNAVIEQESRIIKGDSLIYSPKNKIAEGFCNVFVLDTTDNIAFKADYAFMNDSLKYSLLTEDAMIIKYQKNDTIHIHADTLYNLNDSLDNRKLTLAYHGVKIFGTNMQGIGDSLSYAKEDGYMELYRNPILWAKNGELKGDSIRVYMNDSLVQEARIWGKATAVMEVDSGRYYNQVGGTQMFAYFHENEIQLAKVIGNAQTIFFPSEDGEKELITDTLRFDADGFLIKKNVEVIDSLVAPVDSLARTIGIDIPDKLPIDSLIVETPLSSELLDSTLMNNIADDSLRLNMLSSYKLGPNDTLIGDSLLVRMREVLTIKRMGMNRFYASEIKIYFDSGEVVGVTYYEQPEGVFYPMNQINKEEQFIHHFSTNFALRPKSVEDLLKD